MEKIDEGLKALLESGKEKGYLTYSQVNDYLPDDAVNPEKLDQLLLLLEEQGIELIDESEAEEREGGPPPASADDDARAELDLSFMDEDDSRRIDDPVRMYLTQMGEIPLLKREQEIALAKKIEVTRKRFRRKVLECDCALRQVVDTLKRVHAGELPFDRTVKVSLTENLEKDKILQRMPHNLQDAGAPDGAEQSRTSARSSIRDAPTRNERRPAPQPPHPPPQGRHAGRGAVDPHAEGPAADEEAGADLARGWTSWKSRSRSCKGLRSAKEDRANLREGAARPDAA